MSDEMDIDEFIRHTSPDGTVETITVGLAGGASITLEGVRVVRSTYDSPVRRLLPFVFTEAQFEELAIANECAIEELNARWRKGLE